MPTYLVCVGLIASKGKRVRGSGETKLDFVWPFDPVLAALPDREVAAAQ